MKFLNKLLIKKSEYKQSEDKYIEILIELIRLNSDRTWDYCFQNLREERGLPGGGAGSLNDWGPQYKDHFEDAWYGLLYNVIRYLFDNEIRPEQVINYKAFKDRDKILVIECSNCKKSRQHSSVFERQIAYSFLHKELSNILTNENCDYLFNADLTWNSEFSNSYRSNLKKAYKENEIWVGTTDRVNPMLKCQNCGKKYAFDHVHYRVSSKPYYLKLEFLKRS